MSRLATLILGTFEATFFVLVDLLALFRFLLVIILSTSSLDPESEVESTSLSKFRFSIFNIYLPILNSKSKENEEFIDINLSTEIKLMSSKKFMNFRKLRQLKN